MHRQFRLRGATREFSTRRIAARRAEGYDDELLGHIDFAVHRPVLVIYEHYHLAERDRTACRKRMEDYGYQTLAEGFDTWCLGPDADDRLRRAWRELEPALPEQSVEDEPA